VHERLILNGERTSMAFCPPLPLGHPRLLKSETVPAGQLTPVCSTRCWRKHIGTWALDGGRLHLIDLIGQFQLSGDEPLFADWFTGVLRIPVGEQLQYVHMGFGSVYESELHIRIQQGREIERRTIDNRKRTQNETDLALSNFPGLENRFPGDDYWDWRDPK
jgi:hypothetical protein